MVTQGLTFQPYWNYLVFGYPKFGIEINTSKKEIEIDSDILNYANKNFTIQEIWKIWM